MSDDGPHGFRSLPAFLSSFQATITARLASPESYELLEGAEIITVDMKLGTVKVRYLDGRAKAFMFEDMLEFKVGRADAFTDDGD